MRKWCCCRCSAPRSLPSTPRLARDSGQACFPRLRSGQAWLGTGFPRRARDRLASIDKFTSRFVGMAEKRVSSRAPIDKSHLVLWVWQKSGCHPELSRGTAPAVSRFDPLPSTPRRARDSGQASSSGLGTGFSLGTGLLLLTSSHLVLWVWQKSGCHPELLLTRSHLVLWVWQKSGCHPELSRGTAPAVSRFDPLPSTSSGQASFPRLRSGQASLGKLTAWPTTPNKKIPTFPFTHLLIHPFTYSLPLRVFILLRVFVFPSRLCVSFAPLCFLRAFVFLSFLSYFSFLPEHL
jgi:hypothetical protein